MPPLICTSGPDMLFVASQSLSGSASAGLRSTAGVCLGYTVHSLLVALGVATVIAASPPLFEALRWLGVGYLVYLAIQLDPVGDAPGEAQPVRRARQGRAPPRLPDCLSQPQGDDDLFRHPPPSSCGMATTSPCKRLLLSAIFIGLCALVYSTLSLVVALAGKRGRFSDRRRRYVEGAAGGLLIVAAGRLAAN